MKLIDKDKVVAKIERLKSIYSKDGVPIDSVVVFKDK